MNVSPTMGVRIIAKAAWNLLRKYPLSVSFEVTHACTANCWHCNWGGPIKETRRTAEEYARICRELNPVIAHLSGGEPLARGDLDDILRAMSNPGRLPWMIVVTNASQLTTDRFLRLKRAGMHQLSVSIDFPDERHDDFRRIPGLFDRMDRVIPECTQNGDHGDVTLNCCITSWNFRDLPEIVRLAKRWGTQVNFSAYTALRMDDPRGLVGNSGSQDEFKRSIEEVIGLKRAGMPVYTSERVLWRYYRFLVEGHRGGCKAGYRFVVINPDGRLTPCATVMAYFDDHRSMQRGFSAHNTCGRCFLSTRANTEKGVLEFIQDNSAILKRFLPWQRTTPAAGASP